MVQAQARIFALLSNSALVRGENIADSVTIDKLYIDDTVTPPTAGKLLSNMKMPPSVVNSIPSSQSRAQGRIVAMSGQMTYQGGSSAAQPNQQNLSHSTAPLSLQRIPAQNRSQPLLSRKSNVLVVILKPLLHQKFREIEEDLFYMVGHRLWEPQGTWVLGMVIRTSLEQPSF
ncbi:hypothetical protein Peur_021158 [Populus x canadensis]